MRFEHATTADIAAGLIPSCRSQQMHATQAQRFDVGLHRRMCPHLLIHRRREIQRRSAGQAQCGQQVIGQPVRQPCKQIGAGRCNENTFGPTRQLDMPHRRFGLLVPQADPHALARQRLKRGRTDEVRGALGHDYLHLRVQIAQATDQFAGLVGGDATRHSQQDAALSKTHVRRA